MLDQAEGLRKLAREMLGTRVVAVASGKGGVGKTNVAVNLAIALSQMGRRVIVLDMDLGLANVDVLLDVNSRYNLAHVIQGKREIADALVAAPGGIRILPGASGIEAIANLDADERHVIVQALDKLQAGADFIIVDTSAGISRNVIAFAACADETLIVTTPEPTAMIDAYALIKLIAKEESPSEMKLVVNMAVNRLEADRVASGIVSVAHRFLNVYVEKLGYILTDGVVPAAVKRKIPFVLDAPRSHASACVVSIAKTLNAANGNIRPAPEKEGFFRRLLRKAGVVGV
ncbi:MAG: MinD/ParA family protein [Planctomycetota bacterium]|nr:MinD/ParA family protein [Planctomycetota bacterium]